jgi:hypothetical protein
MFLNRFKSFSNILQLSPYLLADSKNGGSNSNNGGSKLDPESVHEKVAVSKQRRIPVGKFIFMLAVVALMMIVLEYFL